MPGMDDAPPPQEPAIQPEQQLPKIPEPFTIPLSVINKWIGLDEQKYVSSSLGRRDMDHLFFAFDKSLKAQSHLQRCLILFSQGKVEEANAAMRDSEIALAEGQNEFRQFFAAVMASAKTVDSDG